MSRKATWPDKKGLNKEIGQYDIYLGFSWDLSNGKGWFAQAFDKNWHVFTAFHKTNKFTAVRNAIKGLPMNNTISIIIPCKNRLQHLLKCLPAVLAQTWQDIQIIVVDFNCPELSLYDLERTYEPKISVIRVDVPHDHWNLSEARNAGLKMATGDRLLFLDADTLLHPTFIEMEVKRLNENTFGSGLTSPPWNGCGCSFVLKEQFIKVRGYNEAMQGWGMEDMNFYHRMQLEGYNRFEFDPKLISNIPHDDSLRNQFHNGEDKYKTLEENNQKHLKGIFKSSIGCADVMR